jgi:hypothetical protein
MLDEADIIIDYKFDIFFDLMQQTVLTRLDNSGEKFIEETAEVDL